MGLDGGGWRRRSGDLEVNGVVMVGDALETVAAAVGSDKDAAVGQLGGGIDGGGVEAAGEEVGEGDGGLSLIHI